MRFLEMVLGVTVALILFCLVVIPALQQDNEVIRYWQYDDYREAAPGDTVDGSVFELVTVGDTDYIHAKAVGTGTINGASVTVSKAKLDLAFMCGQSNAAYVAVDVSEADPIPKLGTAYYFGTETQYAAAVASSQWWSMLDDDGALRIGDKAPSYCATFNEITGHKVYWVSGAIGGQSLTAFIPPDGSVWTYMNNTLTAALSYVDPSLFELETNYYMWIQGEANSFTNLDVYTSMFLQVHNAMLNGECAGVPFEGCVISLVRPANAINSSVAQMDLAKEYPTIYMGTTAAKGFTVENGLLASDDIHYSQLGDNIIGSDLARYIAGLLGPSASDEDYMALLYMVPVLMVAGLILAIVRRGFE